jgi:hypothetical protein
MRSRTSWRAVGAAVAALSLALGCADVTNYAGRPFRKPGEQLWAFPEKVWTEYACDRQTLPYFEIERFELHPKRMEPGEQFAHRLVYVLCAPTPTAVVTGKLQTRIMYKGKAIVSRDETYDLKPGRWGVDALVELPASAEMGVYAFELDFRADDVKFERSLTFAVDAPAD